ncbi:uncharacterized protein LOC105198612 [Solenopsis invicta]|uniref:uncharacterized protein LOC105198612 n=1 Tax=Solenopsis invicta TaxID=13686 RepID=UPI000595C5ED|nr:uncharacterized protein LOC105198612 [Solenopsis invicta]
MYFAEGSYTLYSGEVKKECNSVLTECRTVRLLSRRYALTATSYKFLEIGINVGLPSYVEIVIGDHQGRELILSVETWKRLHKQRWNISKLIRNDYKDNFISVGPLTIKVSAMNDVRLIRLESSNVYVTMIDSLRHMFSLYECINIMFERLIRIVDTVDVKYTQFLNIASNVMNQKKAIRKSNIFDIRQLIDCELLALFFTA